MTRRVSAAFEARETPRLRLIGIDRECIVAAAAGMGDMIDAAAERTAIPTVINVEGQRGLHVDRGLKR